MSGPEKKTQPEIPDIMRDRRRLGADDRFSFGCHKKLECFTRCCHDVNILLTPVDVLQLSRHLGISTTDFLDNHANIPITKELHLPVVSLRMAESEKKPCPFLGKADEGCTVYEHRPWACRMYPLGMALSPARAGKEPETVHFLFEDDYCDGGGEKDEWTVASWRANQDVDGREELETGFKDIVSHPWFIGGRQLDPKRMQMFHSACYDLDSFRRFVFESTFLDRFEVEPELVEELREDDMALLRFAFRWLRFALFAEPTMKSREK